MTRDGNNLGELPLDESVETSNDFLLNGDFQERVYRLFFDFEFTGIRQDTTPISLGIYSDTGKSFYAEFTDYDRSQVDDWIQENVIAKTKWLHQPINALAKDYVDKNEHITFVLGLSNHVGTELKKWIAENFQTHYDEEGELHNRIEFIGDCCSYDWILLTELIGEWQTCHKQNGIMVDISLLPEMKIPDSVEDFKKYLNEQGVQFVETKEKVYRFGLPKYPDGVNYIPTDICTMFKVRGINPDINRESYAGALLKNYEEEEQKHNALWDAKVIKACCDQLYSDEFYNAMVKAGMENNLSWNGRAFTDADGEEYQLEFNKIDVIR